MRFCLRLLAVLAALGVVASFWAAHSLTRPFNTVVFAPPADIKAETVSFPTSADHVVAGWFVDTASAKNSVLLLHGVSGNRQHQIDRIRLFRDAGYAVLAIDLAAHGESHYPRTTFGHIESHSAHAAIAWLRNRKPGGKVAVIGQSLGGAAALLGDTPVKADAVVLEAVYADIRNATADRIEMWAGAPARILQPILVGAASSVLGISAAQLRPIDSIGKLEAPVMIIAGAKDRHTPIADSRALFSAAREPKELWVIDDAGHYDFERHTPDDYRRRVLGFIGKHLAGL